MNNWLMYPNTKCLISDKIIIEGQYINIYEKVGFYKSFNEKPGECRRFDAKL